MKQLSIRYRKIWFFGPQRAEIWDGIRWVRLSADMTEIQRRADKNSNAIEVILRSIGA